MNLPQSLNWQMQLGALGGVVEDLADIGQAIRIIISTPKGSVPHRPGFGINFSRFIDMPLPAARAPLAREVVDAIALWEPRAKVVSVSVTTDAAGGHRVAVRWRPVDAEALQLTEVGL